MKYILTVILAGSIYASLSPLASADTVCPFSSPLNVSEQTTPGATTGINFGNVCVDLTDNTHALITFQASNGYLFLEGGMADLQVNATSWTVSSPISESPNPGEASNTAPNNVNGYGVFNQIINNAGGAADPESMVQFTLTNTGGTWSSSSNVLTGNADGFDAAAHVVCNDTGTACDTSVDGHPLTFYVAEGAAVPEPRFYAMLLVVLMGVVAIVPTPRPGRKLASSFTSITFFRRSSRGQALDATVVIVLLSIGNPSVIPRTEARCATTVQWSCCLGL